MDEKADGFFPAVEEEDKTFLNEVKEAGWSDGGVVV